MRDNRASEFLLHFIWQYRYYNHRELTTDAGTPLFINYPGEPNTDQGPDFKNARITIGDTFHEGPIELHLKASDWDRHAHTGDPHYQNVILHVVWENDLAEPPADIPILTLHDRTSKTLLQQYRHWMTSRDFVPCASLLAPSASIIPWPAFRDRLLHQRLGHRTAFIRSLIDENSPHWDETLYWLIARSLGQPVNTDSFLAIARSIPLSFLLRRRTDPARLETIFLNQAKVLPTPLSFLRMRPPHSPHIRLRQLAGLLANHSGRFTLLLESDHPAAILDTLKAEGLGQQTRHTLLINAFIPLLSAYAAVRKEPAQYEKALRWLYQTPPENNTIIRRWRQLGLPAATAADTQALLELRKMYCTHTRCLDCLIGQTLLAPAATPHGNP